MVRLLLEHSADVDAVGRKRKTALALALKKGQHDVAELLRAHVAAQQASHTANSAKSD